MIPDLFSGAAAAAAAWPAAAAGAPDPAAHNDTPAAEFADLLAATLAPETEGLVTPRGYALPVSLSDLWLGLATAAASDGESPDAAAEQVEALTADVEDEAPIDVSSPVSVAAAETAVAVPIIVQVPTDIMSVAPVAARGRDTADAAATPVVDARVMSNVAQGVTPQDAPSQPSIAVPSSATLRDARPAKRDDAQDSGERQAAAPIERAVQSMERMESVGGDAPAADAKAQPQQSPQSAGRGVTYRQADPARADARLASLDTKALHIDAKAQGVDTVPSVETRTLTDIAPSSGVPVSTAPGNAVPKPPDGEVPAAGRNDTVSTAGREGAPSSPVTSGTPSKTESTQAPQQSSQTPVAQVTASTPVEQAAQAAVGRGFPPRQDDPAGREGPPYVTDRGATANTDGTASRLTVAVDGVPSAVPSQQGGDASQNGAGQQPSQDAPRDVAPAVRPVDTPAAPPPVAVTTTEAAAKAVMQAADPLTPFTPAQETENMGRLVESMRVQWRQGVPEATVRLNPQHLGEVTISIRVDRGVVSATFHAETPAVQQWLEAQEDKLRNGLADQGLNLERFVVQRERQQQERRDQRPHQQARYRQPQESGQRFEVTV